MTNLSDFQDIGLFEITAQEIRLLQSAMNQPHVAKQDFDASQRVIDSILRILRRQRAQFENIAAGGCSTPAQRATARDQIEKIGMLEAIAASDAQKRAN